MKKVLILSYYWPPAGGGGVQRWLKFSKYLHEFGWVPVIYTPENGETAAYDESLLKEVRPDIEIIRTPIWEPYHFYKKFIGKKKEDKVYSGFISEGKEKSLAQKIAIFIRGNFFIPDARCFWIQPSVKCLTKYLERHPVDAIISTGPPHSMHRIAYGLKQKFANIPWVADFRDPWTNIDFYDQLYLTWLGDYVHKTMEKQVLRAADKIVTVSPSWAKDFEKISGRNDIQVITNGYDPEDFSNVRSAHYPLFTITHLGSMNEDRNPHVLWKAIKQLKTEGYRIKVKLIGQVDHAIMRSVELNGLGQDVEQIKFLPHKAAIEELSKADVLLLPINDTPNQAGVLPGKLYEYLGSGANILCIGKQEGDAAKILSEFEQAIICGYEDVQSCIDGLKQFYSNREVRANQTKIDKYSRKNLAGDYCALLNSLK